MSLEIAVRLFIFFNGVIVSLCGVIDFLYNYCPTTLNKDVHGIFIKGIWPLDLSLIIAGFMSSIFSMNTHKSKQL